jgi:integrase
MKKLEKWLYVHEHETKSGEFSRRYYAILVPWNKNKSVTFALGDDLDLARGKLKRLRALNEAQQEVILDEEKARREALVQQAEAEKEKVKGVTFKEFGEAYFAGDVPVPLVRGKRPKRQRTIDREREIFKNLLPYFGDVSICAINKARVLAFSNERVKVPVTTGRKAGDKSLRNIGHELKFLRYLLNRAVDNDVIAAAPKIKTPQGGHRKSDIKEDEYKAMREAMGREQERYLIALWETGWRLNEPRKLNWNKVDHHGRPLVDLKKRVLRLNPEDVKEDYPRVTPISPELMKVLTELKNGVANIEGAVFVRSNGKPIVSIRESFDRAANNAGIPTAIPHDIRRSTIRRWEAMGVSRPAAMQASGHRPVTVHEKYAEMDEDQLLEAFRVVMQPEQRPNAVRAASNF